MKFKTIVSYVSMAFILLMITFPAIWLAMLSFKEYSIVFDKPPVIFYTPQIDAYVDVFGGESFFPSYLLNSVIISSISTVVVLVLGIFAAYGFARYRFRGRRDLLLFVLTARMLPPIAVLLPFYLIARELGLLDTHIVLITLYTVFNMPLAVWLLKGFIEEVPRELEESAMVDGCGRVLAFFRVVLPLITPGLAATAIFSYVFSWNEFLFAVVLTGSRAKTMPVGISGFWTNIFIGWTNMAAASVVFMIPPLVFAILLRKYFVSGLTMGAVKG